MAVRGDHQRMGNRGHRRPPAIHPTEAPPLHRHAFVTPHVLDRSWMVGTAAVAEIAARAAPPDRRRRCAPGASGRSWPATRAPWPRCSPRRRGHPGSMSRRGWPPTRSRASSGCCSRTPGAGARRSTRPQAQRGRQLQGQAGGRAAGGGLADDAPKPPSPAGRGTSDQRDPEGRHARRPKTAARRLHLVDLPTPAASSRPGVPAAGGQEPTVSR